MPFSPHPSRDFARRVEPHLGPLLGFVRRLLHRPADAQDVLQAALTEALVAHDRYDREASFKAWIYRFALHAALHENRRSLPVALEAGEEEVDAAQTLDLELAYEQVLADPDSILEQVEAPLAEALRELPSRIRAAFLLRTVAELGCGQIATILSVPRGTILSWLFRARVRLRKQLAAAVRLAEERPSR